MCAQFPYAIELSEKFAPYSTNLITSKYFEARIEISYMECFILYCVVLCWVSGYHFLAAHASHTKFRFFVGGEMVGESMRMPRILLRSNIKLNSI